MAIMQLSDMRDWLRPAVGNPSTAETPDVALNLVINESYEEIANRYVFHKVRKIVTFPTVAPTVGPPSMLTARYDIPADCLVVRSLWNTGSTANPNYQYKIIKRDEDWLAAQQTDPTNPISGPPRGYVRQRGWIEFSPAPDDVYTIRLEYKQSVTYMVDDTDEPVTPDSWNMGICYLARVKYWDEVRLDAAKAQAASAVWTAWITDKPVEVQEEDFADNDEGVTVPSLRFGMTSHSRPWSSADFDRMD